MRQETTNIYSFEELSKEAQEKAIEQVRNSYYEDNDFLNWAIDDCALLEPSHNDLINLLGENYNFPLIKNNRKVFCSLDRDRYIDISNAMEITNEKHFLLWLGIPQEMHEKVYYTISNDTIIFEDNNSMDTLTEEDQPIIQAAIEKFEDHCKQILERIENDYEYRFTDESIIEDIEANEIEFLIDGSIYN